MRLSILVRNENELLWSSADNFILVVYPIKFVFSCVSYLVWISLGTNRFEFNSVQVYIGSIRVRVNLDLIRVISDFGSIGVITVSDRFSFGSVQFQILGRNRFNSFSCRFGSDFGLFSSGRLVWVTFARSTRPWPYFIHLYRKVRSLYDTRWCRYNFDGNQTIN